MTYVLSDIHGNLEAFHSILDKIKLNPDDNLYILGDVIDRMPYGIQILKEIMDMTNTYMLLGNHEYMMLRALGEPYDGKDDIKDKEIEELKMLWYYNGGKVTEDAFNALSSEQQKQIINYLKSLPLNYKLVVNGKAFLLVHAAPEELYELVGDKNYKNKTAYCVWNRDDIAIMSKIKNITTIFGHTPTSYYQKTNPLSIFRHKSIIGIDCGAYTANNENKYGVKGRLACLCLENDMEFYS